MSAPAFGEEHAFDVGWGSGPATLGIEAGVEDFVNLFEAAGGAAAFLSFAMKDAEEPGLELRAAFKLVEAVEERHEEVLDEVGGFVFALTKGSGGAVEGAGVVEDGFFQSFRLSPAKAVEEG